MAEQWEYLMVGLDFTSVNGKWAWYVHRLSVDGDIPDNSPAHPQP